MLRDFIINISIMISFTFVWHQLFKRNQLKLQSGLSLKVIDGLIAGVFGVLLMNFSFTINDITILDLRHVAIAMVAFYGGFIPAMIASGVVIAGRYMIDVNYSSHVALFMILAIGLGTGLIGQYVKWGVWKKWTLLLVYAHSIFFIAFWIVSDSIVEVAGAALFHAVMAIGGGYFVLYFARYIRKATDTFYEIQENARKDPLTELFNVRSFDHYYNHYMNEYIETGNPVGLIMLDIDYFKQINDTFGHSAGDEVLKEVAIRLRELTGHQGIISRNGGEEFTVLLPDINKQELKKLAEKVRRGIDDHTFKLKDGTALHLTVSSGVSHTHADLKEELFESADSALYIAKQAGRNQVCALYDLATKAQKESVKEKEASLGG
ncbi:diguanylate cyclase [Jeotgalibacillus terrae]|uniref:Diguanylate cyclase n=1 Tax=Jeotgalibacillus terrae TaxID=587735 RepID=A0ABW5ZCR8_9BACL|nr:diguanylate cyclase [Jeotgalibacillus terrae]MBM7577801.1 diguanylate cyclase [Jeotgalibacillus terrae]